MPTIFISYRRADSAMAAGRLYDRLANDFGAENVFKDVDRIPPGVDFRDFIANEVAQTDIMLALIGPQWATIEDSSGARRLHNPGDFVRIEIESGLEREHCQVVPVLLSNVSMPHEQDLPESLHPVIFLNAVRLRDDPDFNHDADRLIRWIKSLDEAPVPQESPAKSRPSRPLWAIGAVAAAAIIIMALLLLSGALSGDGGGDKTPDETQAQASSAGETEDTAPGTNTPAPMQQPETELGGITVGMNAEYQPFEFVDNDGEITGFDVDLLNAIAAEAGFEVDLVNTRWDGIFVALQQGEFDAVISAATITEEREEIVDFSNPYFNAGQMIAVPKDNPNDIQGPDDLAGLRVGVQTGTTGDITASEIDGAKVIRYDEITRAFEALDNGDIDAIVNDGPVSADIISRNPELDVMLTGDPFTDELYGIAVREDYPELLDAINAGLAAVIADGTYNTIHLKWFGVEAPSMFQPAN